MMNNQLNTTNITTQHVIPMAQHVATSQSHASAAVLSSFLNAQQQQLAAGAIYGDPSQLQLSTNTVDKNYYATTAAPLRSMGTHERFYTATSTADGVGVNPPVNASHHPNTILITNNFTHQPVGQGVNPDQRNIRIVTSNPLIHQNNSDLTTTSGGFQHVQNVFNLNNKQVQHLFPQHILAQSNFQPATTEILHPHFVAQPFSASQPQAQQSHASTPPLQLPHYYVSPENSINTNQKVITNITSNNVTSGCSNSSSSLLGNGSNGNNSTVVLDRINICINNLYTDTSSSSASNSLASTPAQQPSPIIPAIQHKPIIENIPSLSEIYESNVLVIDEPDSTTTATAPHTPPTSPENTHPMPNGINNSNNNIISTTSSNNSPSTSCSYKKIEKLKTNTGAKPGFVSASQNIEDITQNITSACNISIYGTSTTMNTNIGKQSSQFDPHIQPVHHATTLTISKTQFSATSLKVGNNEHDHLIEHTESPIFVTKPLFANGEDVFIKRHDDRFYLGTVIDTARNQFLVRFDDKTEVWCNADEMQKLGNSSTGNTASAYDNSAGQPMCVSCKRSCEESKVEICERCGRGYHQKCTNETSPGSNVWLCKRCSKPMKLGGSLKYSSGEDTEAENFFELSYNVESLKWDDKHQTNAEQIYCYCGKSGKYDNNMLQCWRCLNWYHTHCTQKFRNNLLRGDFFFVFCCSVCNDGDEYIRRIQASWVDLVHLVLYNLSILKKHHKYHHLLKDINPYILEKRKRFPIPKQWISMQEKEFLNKVKSTLNENNEIFVCGKDVKRDINSFALRSIEPPKVMKFSLKPQDIFNDDFVFNNLKVSLLNTGSEYLDFNLLSPNSVDIEDGPKSKRKSNDSNSRDIYEFDDTSDDEIPIKQILDKVKKTKLTPLSTKKHNIEEMCSIATTLEKIDVEDDNANDALITILTEEDIPGLKYKREQTPKKEGNIINCPLSGTSKFRDRTSLALCEKPRSLNTKQSEKSSRKRKAFTFSKSYKTSHLFDSSSDENSSSSSRGTSLDLIIPPPKNFLGQNNPFRIISPKKSNCDVNASTFSNKKAVSFNIFNTAALNFSSKLNAFKSTGLFSNFSTTNLAKAAGQPRTVRTIKRRLSAKDITIGPNKEVRRRRTKRLSSSIEVISTTTINPIPANFFPIQAKDLLAAAAASATTAASLFSTQTKVIPSTSSSNAHNSITTSTSSSPHLDSINTDTAAVAPTANSLPTHGRCLRQRPQKTSPNTSRRSSVSSNSSTSAAGAGNASQSSNPNQHSQEELKLTVNKFFGIVSRIESGEQFSIRAKRQLANGQMQYLIEWGETKNIMIPTLSIIEHFSNQKASINQLLEVPTTG